MLRQIAIASPGRAASTTLFRAVILALRHTHRVYHIWDFSPVRYLDDAYARPAIDAIVVKGETYHFIDHLQHRDRTDLILLTRGDKLAQMISHLVSLRSGRFHAEAHRAITPFRVGRDECLFLAHFILMTERYFSESAFDGFREVYRWLHEDLVKDFPGHLARLGLTMPQALTPARGVSYHRDTIENLDELRKWCEEAGLPQLGSPVS
jgi:hypothetical protein